MACAGHLAAAGIAAFRTRTLAASVLRTGIEQLARPPADEAFVLAVPTRRGFAAAWCCGTLIRPSSGRMPHLLAEREAPSRCSMTGRAYSGVGSPFAAGPGVFVPARDRGGPGGPTGDRGGAGGAEAAYGIRSSSTCAPGRGRSRSPSRMRCRGRRSSPSNSRPQARAWAARNRDLLAPDIRDLAGDATTALGDPPATSTSSSPNPPYIPTGPGPGSIPRSATTTPPWRSNGRSADGLPSHLRVAAPGGPLPPWGSARHGARRRPGGGPCSPPRRRGRWRDLTDPGTHRSPLCHAVASLAAAGRVDPRMRTWKNCNRAWPHLPWGGVQRYEGCRHVHPEWLRSEPRPPRLGTEAIKPPTSPAASGSAVPSQPRTTAEADPTAQPVAIGLETRPPGRSRSPVRGPNYPPWSSPAFPSRVVSRIRFAASARSRPSGPIPVRIVSEQDWSATEGRTPTSRCRAGPGAGLTGTVAEARCRRQAHRRFRRRRPVGGLADHGTHRPSPGETARHAPGSGAGISS